MSSIHWNSMKSIQSNEIDFNSMKQDRKFCLQSTYEADLELQDINSSYKKEYLQG